MFDRMSYCAKGCVVLATLAAAPAAWAASHTVKFENLVIDTEYGVGDVFASNGVQIEVQLANLSVGEICDPSAGGFVRVDATSLVPCSGSANQKRALIYARLEFDTNDYVIKLQGAPVRRIKFLHSQFSAGNVELMVNGQCSVQPTFADMNGTIPDVKIVDDGCQVTVTALNSIPIVQFAIGGVELYIDNVKATD